MKVVRGRNEPEPEPDAAVDPAPATDEVAPTGGSSRSTKGARRRSGRTAAPDDEEPAAGASSADTPTADDTPDVRPEDKVSDVFARLRSEDATGITDEGASSDPVDAVPDAPADVEAGEDAADALPDDEAAPPLEGPARLLAERDAALADLERNLARRLKRELSDEQNELLSSLASAKGTPTVDAVLPDLEAHAERIRAAALPSLAAAATAGAELLAVVGGRAAGGSAAVADLASELAADVVVPLRDRLERAFDGGEADEVAQRIRAGYREWKGQRIDQLARQAVVAAANRGLLEVLPEGTLVQWVVAEGDAPSPDCEDNALAGTIVVGEAFPTGHTAPPLHAACRCIVVPADA